MITIWDYPAPIPLFRLDAEERAIVIGALRLCAEKDSSEKLALMLHTFEEIDKALIITANLKRGLTR